MPAPWWRHGSYTVFMTRTLLEVSSKSFIEENSFEFFEIAGKF